MGLPWYEVPWPWPLSRWLPGDPRLVYPSCPPSSFPFAALLLLAGELLSRSPSREPSTFSFWRGCLSRLEEWESLLCMTASFVEQKAVCHISARSWPILLRTRWLYSSETQRCLFSVKIPCLVDQMAYQISTLALCLQLYFQLQC